MPTCPSCGKELPGEFPFCPFCAAPLESAAEAPREQRKTVTVLFCDVTGSTALGESTDPEALRALLARYFERMKRIVESHGGTVEKFIGDAVMAVFGVPQVHEDDALRAVRAAVEMRNALPELGVQARIGVNTGEVVTGTAERLATGDAVNVAARLEQAAQPGEVLVGEETFRLVRDAVESVQVESLALKGKAEPVVAFRLLAVGGELSRRHEAPMVARETELSQLRAAFDKAVRDRSCQLFTILGNAGVGKSRLAAEFLRAVEATIVRGRCLAYGEGITYWPVVEVIKQLPEQELDPAARKALASVLGEEATVTSSDEIAWAFRKLLEASTLDRALVCVFDDIHWGEETFLDLVEHVADLSREAPILLLCMARPDLLDRRSAWAGGKMNATNVLLEPLSTAETEQLITSLAVDLPEHVFRRVVEAAEGNPLFVEEMVALADESGDEEITVPPTIHALLAARIDQLDPAERLVLERGAIEGRTFHRGAVQALTPEESQVTTRLTSLVRKELVRPDAPQLPGEDAFRFRHLLIRDAAYEALPKAVRADLHERFAFWLEEHGTGIVELDEIVGYHLEQAIRYRRELGHDASADLAVSARIRLRTAGLASSARGDNAAAVKLLERAAALLAPGEIDLALEAQLMESLFWGGRGDDALRRAISLAEQGAASGDRVVELCGRVREWMYRTFRDPEGATDRLEAVIEQALPVFEDAGNDLALYIAHRAAGQVGNMRARADAGRQAFERAAFHAERAGLPERFEGWRALCGVMGTTPPGDVVAWIDELEMTEHWILRQKAHALAMLGRFAEAEELLQAVRAELLDRGELGPLASMDGFQGIYVALLAGEVETAVARGESACAVFEELGEQSVLSSIAGHLARALCAAERFGEAEEWAARAAELGASDDALTQYLWRQAKARALAHRGEHAEAERLAREAIAVADATDFLDGQADAYSDLAEVLGGAGKVEQARSALDEAIARYERKGNVVMVERTRARLAELQAAVET